MGCGRDCGVGVVGNARKTGPASGTALATGSGKLSMETGRAPSLLGREMFRGNVTHYNVQGFDDVVIFVHDVERCLQLLDRVESFLIHRIALQEYTQPETALMLNLPVRSVVRRYDKSLDILTRLFLDRKLLQPLNGLKTCQDVEISK